MENDPLVFDVNIAKEKPNSYRKVKNNSGCPFCNVAELTNIIKRQGGRSEEHTSELQSLV